MRKGVNGIDSGLLNFQKLCRICMQEKRILVSIFDSIDENYNLAVYEKIMACALINLSRGDGLPERICIPCLSRLNATFEFRLQCESSDKMLHLLLNNQTEGEDVGKRESKREIDKSELSSMSLNKMIVIREEKEEMFENQRSNFLSESEEKGNGVVATKLSCSVDVVKKNMQNRSDLDLRNFGANDSLVSGVNEVKEEEGVSENLDELTFGVKSSCSGNTDVVWTGCSEEGKGQTEGTPVQKRVLSEGKKSSCPFCHKMLYRVNEHVRLLHRNKVYICNKPGCSAEFLTLKNLQSHQLRCFNMEKPYKCSSCSKEFYRKCNYNAHTRRHSNKRDFQCQLCEKAFVDSTGLRRHFLKHHEPQQEVFVVGCCGKKFKTKKGLRQHVEKGICGVQVFQVMNSQSGVT